MVLADNSNFLIPNATFVVEVIAFLIILAILWKYALPVVQRMMTERQESIREGLQEADEGRALRRQAEAEYQAKLEEARRESRVLVDQATRLGEQIREEARQRANEEYQTMVTRAQVEIDRSAERASAELRRQLADLVVETSRRVLGRELPPDLQRSLVDEATSGIESSV
jgi:F-type H+-transporting ATPase subunit b